MIRHTVVFRLHHAAGSEGEKAFFAAAAPLVDIPGVKNFHKFREVSPKNDFAYCFAMDFDTQETYDAYSNHPVHDAFVQKIWLRDVADFLEIDLVED